MAKTSNIQVLYECIGDHSHEYPQILVPLQKALDIRVGNTEYEVTPQELCFVPAGMQHKCNYVGKLLAINLSEDMVDNQNSMLISYPMIVPMQGQINQLVDLIQTEVKNNPHSQSVRYLYSFLFSKLLENCSAPSIRYINEYYYQPITVDQLARIENYNVTYYNDWFKQKTGLSPSYYLRCIRISRAKELLTTTNFSVLDIAVMVGYSSNATFTRAFHNVTGQTPKEYRNSASVQAAV